MVLLHLLMPLQTISRRTETEQGYKEEKESGRERDKGANQKAAREDQGAFECTAYDFASKVLSLVDIKGKLKPTKDEKKVAK